MEDMNELQMTCFEIISYVGTAKSMYINAVQKAKEGDFDAAEELIKQGDEAYNGGHDVHMGLLKEEANGERNGEAPPPGAFIFGEGLARPIKRPFAFPQIKPAKTNLSLFGRFLPWERYHTGNV